MRTTKILSTVLCVLAICLILNNKKTHASFKDVSPSHAYATAINYLSSQKIITGYADNTFRPNQPLNREELIKIILTANQVTITDQHNCFEDLYDRWSIPYICTAKEKGLIQGQSKFYPEQQIKFTEASKIIVQSLSIDLQESDPWYVVYIAYLDQKNAIPTSINHLEKPLTRGEVAEIIYRLKTDKTNKSSFPLARLNPNFIQKKVLGIKTSQKEYFLKIISPQNYFQISKIPFYITGQTSPNCQSITVIATNPASKINDVYKLNTFKKGDSIFKYGLQPIWKNIGFGQNKYKFIAQCGKTTLEEKFEIIYQKKDPLNHSNKDSKLFEKHKYSLWEYLQEKLSPNSFFKKLIK